MRARHTARVRQAWRLPRAFLWAACAALAPLLGCDPQQATPDVASAVGEGTVSISVHWPTGNELTRGVDPTELEVGARGSEVDVRTIPSATETIDVAISGTGIAPDVTATVSKPEMTGAVTTVQLRVPAGTGRQLLATARSSLGEAVAGAKATFDVVAGLEAQVPVEILRGPADAAWPIWGGQLSNSRLTSAVAPSGSWVASTEAGPGGPYTGLVVGRDGTRYLGTAGGLRAYYPGRTSLDEKWTYPFAWGPPTVPAAVGSDSTVFAGSGQFAVAITTDHGLLRWAKQQLFSNIVAAPTIGPAGTLYYALADGTVRFLDPRTGSDVGRFPIAGNKDAFTPHPAIDPFGNVYICDSTGHVWAFDGTTGDELWSFTGDGTAFYGPALGTDGTLYCASAGGRVYSLNMQDGTQRWVWPSPSASVGPFGSGPALGADGSVRIGDRGAPATLYCLEGAAGTLRWQWPSADSPAGSPVPFAGSPIVDGTSNTIVVNENGAIYARNGADGTSAASIGLGAPGGGSTSPIIDADGIVRWTSTTGNQIYIWAAN